MLRHSHYSLRVRVAPLPMPAALSDQSEAIVLQDGLNLLAVQPANVAHQTAIFSICALGFVSMGVSSRNKRMASRMFCFASSSVAPAETHPGSSGHQTAYSPVSGSCSRTILQIMPFILQANLRRVSEDYATPPSPGAPLSRGLRSTTPDYLPRPLRGLPSSCSRRSVPPLPAVGGSPIRASASRPRPRRSRRSQARTKAVQRSGELWRRAWG